MLSAWRRVDSFEAEGEANAEKVSASQIVGLRLLRRGSGFVQTIDLRV
jgi:hypothetical protein